MSFLCPVRVLRLPRPACPFCVPCKSPHVFPACTPLVSGVCPCIPCVPVDPPTCTPDMSPACSHILHMAPSVCHERLLCVSTSPVCAASVPMSHVCPLCAPCIPRTRTPNVSRVSPVCPTSHTCTRCVPCVSPTCPHSPDMSLTQQECVACVLSRPPRVPPTCPAVSPRGRALSPRPARSL